MQKMLCVSLGGISDRSGMIFCFVLFLVFDFISYIKLLQLYYLWLPITFFSIVPYLVLKFRNY